MSCTAATWRSRRGVDHDRSTVGALPEAALDGAREAHDDLLELGVGRDVGRREQNGVAGDAIDIAARGIADEPVLERALPDGLRDGQLGGKGSARRAVGDQLDANEKPPAPYVPHRLVAGERLAQCRLELRSGGPHALEEPVALD